MSIRFATLNDVPTLIEIGSRMHAITRFKTYPFNAQKTANSLAALVRHDKGKYAVLVAENSEHKMVGGLIGLIEQPMFSDAFIASIMHIDVLPEARMGGYGVRLIKAFEQWAKNRDAFEICFGVNSGAELMGIAATLEKLNYTKVGENFVKESQ
jgi:GNAT superfamily N-acetyltransferase